MWNSPYSSSDIQPNKEVIFRDSSGREREGTVMIKWFDDTFNIQGTDGNTYQSVPYARISKYRSK
jgi:hypothetical protein